MNLKDKIDQKIFHLVGEAADAVGQPCYIVGGYVRDIFLHRPSNDIDFVTVGSGIGLAVCDESIRLHDGTLTIGNAKGGGCIVTIRLPVMSHRLVHEMENNK